MARFRFILFFIIGYIFITNKSLHYELLASSLHISRPHQVPAFVEIPSLQLVLPVEVAQLQDDEWIMTDDKAAFYGQDSAFPGNPGITIVFAHARQGLFAGLPLLKDNNVIVLQTKDTLYFYQVEERKTISPLQVDFLTAGTKNRENVLAVFTCFGPGDEKRLILFAPLKQSIPVSVYQKNLEKNI